MPERVPQDRPDIGDKVQPFVHWDNPKDKPAPTDAIDNHWGVRNVNPEPHVDHSPASK